MSLDQEYNVVRKNTGNDQTMLIEVYLANNPQFSLSDIQDDETVKADFEKWTQKYKQSFLKTYLIEKRVCVRASLKASSKKEAVEMAKTSSDDVWNACESQESDDFTFLSNGHVDDESLLEKNIIEIKKELQTLIDKYYTDFGGKAFMKLFKILKISENKGWMFIFDYKMVRAKIEKPLNPSQKPSLLDECDIWNDGGEGLVERDYRW